MQPWKSSMLGACLFTLSFTLSNAGQLRANDPAAKQPALNGPTNSKSGIGEQKTAKPANVQALYRFYDHELNEHLYSSKQEEVADWRLKKHLREHVIIGDISPVALPGTVRLWRGSREDGKHYFYFKAAGKVPNVKVEDNKFEVWVWTKAGDGRIPVYGHTWTDDTDVFLEVDLKNVSKFRADSQDALGVSRLSLSDKGDETPVFYVYPHAAAKDPKVVPLANAQAPKEPPKKSEPGTVGKKSARPDNLQPFIRFYNDELNEHIYSLKPEELEEWRKKKTFREQIIIGDASPVELPGTLRLWRAVRDDGKHYFYFKSSGKGPKLKVEDLKFQVWVWTEPGDGRIPIYGNTWIDETDIFLDDDFNNVDKFRTDSLTALGVNRLSLAEDGDGTPIFYVYPHVVPKDAKPKAK
ncbi:MAG: hypothetical protein JWM11_1285 [Planctomycetaceae bacterium]|nr:hypothetical protein [Planctomycetaceae bacterium]